MAWSRVQSASSAATTTASTKAVTFTTANLTSGTKIIALVAVSAGSPSITSVKDGAGNTMTSCASVTHAGEFVVGLFAMDTPAGDVGTKPTITATLGSSSSETSILVQEVSGLATGNTTGAMIDGTFGTGTGTGGSSTGSPTYSSSASNEYLVACYGDDGGPETWTKPAALTADTNSVNTNSHADCALAFGNSTNGTEAGSWALSGTSADWGTLLVAFKLSGGTPASVTGVVATDAIAAPTGTVSAGATITGVVATDAIAAPTGTVSAGATVTGVTATMAIAAPAGTGGLSTVGVPATDAIAAPAGTVSAGATITGVVAPDALAAPTGSVSAGATVTGVVATDAIAAPAGSVHAGATITGVVAPDALAAPAGSVHAAASITGVPATVSVAAAPGTAGATPPVIVQQVAGTATFDYGLSTVAMTTGAGNTLIVLAGWDLSTVATSASMPVVYVTDSAGNYWYHAGTSSSSVTGSRSAAWVCVNSRPISWLSVSLTTFASSLAYTVIEVANMPAYFSPDVSGANAVASATSLAVSPGSAVSDDIGFSVLAAGTSGLTAPSTPAGWTALTPVTSGAGDPNPVQIFPFWNSGLDAGTDADITYTVAQAVPLSGVTFGIVVAPPLPLQPNPEFPRLKVEAAFGFTPGDPSLPPPSWTDITPRAISKSGDSFISSTMGHQYELAQMEAGELTIAIDNHDGAFTPGNTASVFYPNVVLGTPVRVSAYWDGHWYYVGQGWVERWPQEWPDLPQWGMSKMIATDAVATMSAASMVSALASDILIDAPYIFIPGSEQYTTLVGGLNPTLIPADAQGLLAANDSRSNQRTGVYVDGTAGTCDTGQATNLLGDSDTGFGTTSISDAPTQPSSGPGVIYTDPGLPEPGSVNGVSVEFWVIIPAATASTLQPLVFSAYGPASNYGTGKPSLSVRINSFSGATMTITTAAGNTISAPFNPGTAAQQVVLTITSTSIAVYVNGGLSATASLAGSDTSVWNAVSLGCPNYAYQAALGEIGNYTAFDLAIYPYQLSTQRILSHYVTGFSGQQGSDATARMAQILSWANLPLARAGQVLFGDPGVMEDVAQGPAYSLEGQSAADGLNQLVLNESGLAFAAPSGAVQFVHRWALFNQAPAAIFGDSTDVALGEVPYLPAMSWDYDITYLDNVVQVTQQVGANNTITVTSADFTSQAAYFLRSPLTQTIQTTSDLDAYSLADWEIAKYSQPELRVAGVTVDAASNPATAFPAILAIQQGQAVTATRRPVGGAEISEQVLVQKIEHSIGPGKWQTSYQLSPYTPEDAVLQLDEPTYDVLGDNTLP